jgi:hypothetical protein
MRVRVAVVLYLRSIEFVSATCCFGLAARVGDGARDGRRLRTAAGSGTGRTQGNRYRAALDDRRRSGRGRVEHCRSRRGGIGTAEPAGRTRQFGVTEVLPLGPDRFVDAHNQFHLQRRRHAGEPGQRLGRDRVRAALAGRLSTDPSGFGEVENPTSPCHGPVAPPYVAILYSVATSESCSSRIRRRTVSRCSTSMSSRSGTVSSPPSTSST